MSSLFVDRRNVHLDLDAGAIIFRQNGQRIGTVPVAPITRVILRGSVTLNTSLLGQLGEHGAGVIILSGRQGKPSLMLSMPHKDARRRVHQTRLSLDPHFCLHYARHLIHTKIDRQCQWFEQLRASHPQARYPLSHALSHLRHHQQKTLTAPNLGSLRGIEGSAASTYFTALSAILPASLNFTGRNRRPPRDPFNALLSLTYTLATAEIAIALHAAGLDPAIGYYHQLSHDRESLACDLLETIRPLADRHCYQLITHQTLTADHFSHSPTTGCHLGKAGRPHYYQAWEQNTTPLRQAIQQSIQHLTQTIASHHPEPPLSSPTEAP